MAARYWVGGTANWDGTAGTKWSTTSGGAGGAAVPTSADDVFFDANSGAATVTVTAPSVGLTLNFTGFTGTFAGASQVTISGNVTIVVGMGLTYTGTLIINATSTLTSNGKTWSGALSFGGSNTKTLADNWTVTGTFSVLTSTTTINGNTLNLNGNMSIGGITTGTTNINLTGTGTWTGAAANILRNDLTINTAGTITVSGTVSYNTGTITYSAGTVITTGSTLTLGAASTTTVLLVNGITWANITTTGGTLTLTQNLNLTGTLLVGTAALIINTGTINTGGLNHATSGSLTGTANIVFNGTGTWSGGGGATQVNITINTTGTLTLSSSTTIFWNTGTLTYTAGTVISTGNQFTCVASSTFNCGGMSFNNVTFSNPTITLSSDLNLNGTLTINNTTVTINGNTINTKSLTMTTASAGTTNFVLNGTGTWSGSGVVGNNLTINHAGTTTVSGTVTFGASGKTLTYTAGTVTTTGSTLSTSVAATFNTAGITWNNFTTKVQGTITINSLLNISGTLTLSPSGVGTTFTGTSGWTCGTFTCTTIQPVVFKSGLTYNCNTSFTITVSTNASRILFSSSIGGTRAIFTLGFGASQNVGFVNATDIDSSLGQTIWSFNGVLSNTLNWSVLTYPKQTTFSFQRA